MQGQLIVTRWFDKQEVTTLSSFHLPELRETWGPYEVKHKPMAVIDYVNVMSGVIISIPIFLSYATQITKMVEKNHLPPSHTCENTDYNPAKQTSAASRKISNLAAVVKDLIVSLISYDINLPFVFLKERHFIKLCPETDGAMAHGKKAKRQCNVCTDRAKRAGQTREQ
ncbi:hypothetical protein PoB_006366000 [Plakobranchus ocellatus]|uniref:PiggyBac transposable element-derived protein domain-containing protein n=1 Tax=Plakobranchus ocellatus TaxID=259542 RepID=A0AAV4CZF1_9GAST|nr:hypothetical protein PoB_006366000 [Plakobranchus ocellatus]